MKNDDDNWYWGKQMVACFDDLRKEFGVHHPPVVDREIMPQFSGSPDDMFLWFICEKADDVQRLKSNEGPLKSRIQDRMKIRGFPNSATDSLQVGSTSLEDIEEGGGRFYYFR